MSQYKRHKNRFTKCVLRMLPNSHVHEYIRFSQHISKVTQYNTSKQVPIWTRQNVLFWGKFKLKEVI